MYDFINSGGVKDATAFIMKMTSADEETDCTRVVGSNSMFEFRYFFIICGHKTVSLTVFRATKTPGEVYVRPAPCVCEACLSENWDECLVGGWKLKKMEEKGTRNPNQKHIEQQLSKNRLVIGTLQKVLFLKYHCFNFLKVLESGKCYLYSNKE